MAAIPNPIPARLKQVNRAEVVDQNFLEYVRGHAGQSLPKPQPGDPVLAGSALDARGFMELFESQLVSRHLDLMARVLRVQNKVFYTIGSAGHEGNAVVGARCAPHRSGLPALPLRRLHGRALPQAAGHGPDLGFGAVASPPARTTRPPAGATRSGARKPLWVLPQTSTIAQPSAQGGGHGDGDRAARRIGHALPMPADSIVICSFGDASANHATALGAFNAARWTAHQSLPAPVLFVCEDNGIGISVRTPERLDRDTRSPTGAALDYFRADGLDLAEVYGDVARGGRALPRARARRPSCTWAPCA